MLDVNGHAKLVDFGLAVKLNSLGSEEPMSPTGSLIYMAPEMLSERMGGCFTDWWAVGVLAHELMTGRTPWSSLTDKKLIRKEIQTVRVVPPSKLSPQAGHFICSLLRQDRHERLGSKDDAAELRKMSFFKDIDWAAMERGETAPAFVPKPNSGSTEEDKQATLESYLSRQSCNPQETGAQGSWMLGLDVVCSHPTETRRADPQRDVVAIAGLGVPKTAEDDGNFFF